MSKNHLIIIIVVIALSVILMVCYSLFQKENQAIGHFRFSFAGIDENGNIAPLVRKEITGEMLEYEIQMFFQPIKNTYLYILLFDNVYNIISIFPDRSFDEFYNDYDNYDEYYILKDKNLDAFIQDDQEYKLHIIFSVKRLPVLEKELSRYFGLSLQPENESIKTAGKGIIANLVSILQNILLTTDKAPKEKTEIMGTERSAEALVKGTYQEYYFRNNIYEIYSIKK